MRFKITLILYAPNYAELVVDVIQVTLVRYQFMDVLRTCVTKNTFSWFFTNLFLPFKLILESSYLVRKCISLHICTYMYVLQSNGGIHAIIFDKTIFWLRDRKLFAMYLLNNNLCKICIIQNSNNSRHKLIQRLWFYYTHHWQHVTLFHIMLYEFSYICGDLLSHFISSFTFDNWSGSYIIV